MTLPLGEKIRCDCGREKMYRIGEFSKIVKLTVKTLRFYDEVDLLKPCFIDDMTGYRYYSIDQLFNLQQIVALRQAGFSIEQIKYVLSGENVKDLLDAKELELKKEHQSVIEKISRLSSIKKFYEEEGTMNYQVVVKKMPECVVYYTQFKVRDFSEYAEKIPQIGQEISEANPNLECAKPDYCYIEYIDGEFKEKDFRVEYAQAVEKIGNETRNIKFKTLPEMEMACVMHKGSYDGLRKAYGCLVDWIEQNGFEICGNGREQYIDGCWNKEKEEDFLTEVQFPVKRK